MNLANEGLEARKKEEEVQAKKRKAEDDRVWEGACVIIKFKINLYSFFQIRENKEWIVGVPLPDRKRKRRPKVLLY